jgi:hypothetical protein
MRCLAWDPSVAAWGFSGNEPCEAPGSAKGVRLLLWYRCSTLRV